MWVYKLILSLADHLLSKGKNMYAQVHNPKKLPLGLSLHQKIVLIVSAIIYVINNI